MSPGACALFALLSGNDVELPNGQFLRFVSTRSGDGIGIIYRTSDGEEHVALDPLLCATLQRLAQARVIHQVLA